MHVSFRLIPSNLKKYDASNHYFVVSAADRVHVHKGARLHEVDDVAHSIQNPLDPLNITWLFFMISLAYSKTSKAQHDFFP